MSILRRRSEIEEVEKKANKLIDFGKKSQANLDTIICGYFTRKEITSGRWGFDKECLLENLQLWGYSKDNIEKILDQLISSKLLQNFKWRNRDIYDFAYRDKLEFQIHFIELLKDSPLFRSRVEEFEKDIDSYLLRKVKEEKDEDVASTLRLLFSLSLPEIGTRSELGSIAEFHFKSISGEKWVDLVTELIQKKIVLMRLNFLSSNVASEYFIPEYARSVVSTYINYANMLLKRKLETLIPFPLFDQRFQVLEEHKSTLLKKGLCYRKWTTPKVKLTENFIPTRFLHQIFIEEIVEIPELIIKSYPDDELWTYYLIGRALINAKHSISISSPYTDHTTLTHFVKTAPKDVEIRILTSRIGGKKKERKFFEVLQEMWKDGYRIEVLKILRESGRVPLHDRYVIQDNKIAIDLPGDLKRGFSGKDKAENIKWIPLEEKVVVYNDQFSKLWNMNFSESDFVSDSSSILGVRLSFTKPDLATTYRISLVNGKIKKEKKTVSFNQFFSQI